MCWSLARLYVVPAAADDDDEEEEHEEDEDDCEVTISNKSAKCRHQSAMSV